MFFHQLGDQIRLFDHSDHMYIVVLELKLIRKKILSLILGYYANYCLNLKMYSLVDLDL